MNGSFIWGIVWGGIAITTTGWWLYRRNVAAPLRTLQHRMNEFPDGNPAATSPSSTAQSVQELNHALSQLMQRLHRIISEHQRLGTLRSQFAANVTHELKTPLAAIGVLSETLLGGALEDKEVNRSMVERIHQQSLHLSTLIDDILQLSEIETGKEKSPSTDLSIRIIMEEVVGNYLEMARGKGVALSIAKVPLGLAIPGERNLLTVILRNLIDNGIKFNHAGGKVTLRCFPQDNDVILEVEDTGMGISLEHLPRIFERFYRADPSRSRELGGTGLGLALVKHAVELLNGKISVKSVEGQGTIFQISLPQK